jgi:hypothetical protein
MLASSSGKPGDRRGSKGWLLKTGATGATSLGSTETEDPGGGGPGSRPAARHLLQGAKGNEKQGGRGSTLGAPGNRHRGQLCLFRKVPGPSPALPGGIGSHAVKPTLVRL